MVHQRSKWVWRANDKAVWTYDFNFKGSRYTGSTSTKSKRLAEQCARAERDRVVAEWHRQYPHGTRKRSKPIDLTFGEAVASYVDNVGKFERNYDENKKHLLRLCEAGWIGASTLCSDIDTAMVHRIVAKRRSEALLSRPKKLADGSIRAGSKQVWVSVDGKLVKRIYIPNVDRSEDVICLSPAYVNRSTCDLIKRILNYVADCLGIASTTCIAWKRIRLKEPEPEIVEVKLQEEDQIEPLLVEGYGAAFQFSILAGMRLENFTDLRWSQVDFSDRLIKLHQKGRGGIRKVHLIRIDEEMERILRLQWGRDPIHVFVFRASKTWKNPKNGQRYESGRLYPITYWGFASWWKGIQKMTGLSHLTPHSFRRTAASRLVRDTGSLVAAQNLLGHSDIRTTAKHYAKLSGDDVLEAQRKSRIVTADRRAAMRQGNNSSQTAHNPADHPQETALDTVPYD